jgi:hypothetical protein
MNKQMLLDWLLREAEKHEKDMIHKVSFFLNPHQILLEDLSNLDHGREVTLSDNLPNNPNDLVNFLRDQYNDKVTLISRILNENKPDCYIYYNVSKLENEIFDGIAYFSDIVPEFRFSFDRIGKKGIERYLQFNQAIIDFAHQIWPRQKNIQGRIMYFLYNGLGKLFLANEDIRRYWIVTSGEVNFSSLDQEDITIWSACKEMRPGDLIFVYRTSPRKAITDLFRAVDEPFFDPYWSWDGFKIKMERICQMPEIFFSQMRVDPVFKEWNAIKKQFEGVIAEPIPNRIYNHLLDYVPSETRKNYGLEPETLALTSESGKYESEAEFEEKAIVPLLKKLGLKFEYQHLCPFHVGSQVIRGRVDFLVSNERGPLTLFEDKVRIRTNGNNDLEPAILQARSYALLLGLPSFVVAAPEGLWIYRLQNHKHDLVRHFSPEILPNQFEEVRTTLEKIQV